MPVALCAPKCYYMSEWLSKPQCVQCHGSVGSVGRCTHTPDGVLEVFVALLQ